MPVPAHSAASIGLPYLLEQKRKPAGSAPTYRPRSVLSTPRVRMKRSRSRLKLNRMARSTSSVESTSSRLRPCDSHPAIDSQTCSSPSRSTGLGGATLQFTVRDNSVVPPLLIVNLDV